MVLFKKGILEFYIPGKQFIDHFLPLTRTVADRIRPANYTG
jgi:hypothetical protein